MLAVFGSEAIELGGAGPLAVVAAAFVSCYFWQQEGWEVDDVSERQHERKRDGFKVPSPLLKHGPKCTDEKEFQIFANDNDNPNKLQTRP